MNDNQPSTAAHPAASRRRFLRDAGAAAAATTLSGIVVPRVHAAEDHTIQVALIGCGGRGTGAAANALAVKNGPLKLVALADVFADRLSTSHNSLAAQFAAQMDVPEERRFLGFDAYHKALACLRPGDVAICATPPAFRWVHFAAAIERGVNVFMEKPVSVDGASSRKMLELAQLSEEKNLKVGVGLMCRHCDARRELFDRIQAGEIGEITALRAYRMTGPTGSAAVGPNTSGMSELLYQIRNFHGFLWASGGAFSDFLIHNIDECCWMKNAWPIQAEGSGGRHYRGTSVDQNFDNYTVEYTFADGAKLHLRGRTMPGCYQQFASYAQGTRGSAVISTASHSPARCRTFRGQNFVKEEQTWHFPGQEPSPYQLEWDHLIDAIRQDKPFNEARRGTEASLVSAMGRLAAHTGQRITWDETLQHPHELAPGLDQLTADSPAPVRADEQGKYPVPMPGIKTDREY